MHDDPTHDHRDYFAALADAGEALDDAMAAVREEQDAGRVTQLEACLERCDLLERHLRELARLRAEHLGGTP
jgi:acyl-CoA reductase-like NAD-dependent aldehyde dehydrogenase